MRNEYVKRLKEDLRNPSETGLPLVYLTGDRLVSGGYERRTVAMEPRQ